MEVVLLKRGLLGVVLSCLCLLSTIVRAGPLEEYEEAYNIYIAAGTSAASYSGRMGELVNRYLEQDGWAVDHYVQEQGRPGIRFIVARKKESPDCFVAIVGTENKEDIRTDIKVRKVYFAGKTIEEFAANAEKKGIPDTEPKVHRGFHDFVQTTQSAVLRNTQQAAVALPDLLQPDKGGKVYLTGHSLGGAAATLLGARLISMGVNPERIAVITFGAPAVGNAAFAEQFAAALRLTRVVNDGDPVTRGLQALVGGYRQFGKEIRWKAPDTVGDAHQLSGYIDSALKNYYDKRRQAVAAGITVPLEGRKNGGYEGRVYAFPLKNRLPAGLAAEFFYMQEALQEEYRKIMPDYIAAGEGRETWRQAAMEAGCRWAVVAEVSAERIRQERNAYAVTLHQTIYDVPTGAVIDVAIFSTGTYQLTPLEAFIHAFKGIYNHLDSKLVGKNERELTVFGAK